MTSVAFISGCITKLLYTKISWADYKEKINSVEAANTFRKIVEGSTRHTLGTLEKPDGTITSPGPDTVSYTHLTLPTNREV